MIFTSIRYNLVNLLRFSGRESRALFWPYAIAVFLLEIVAAILLFIPVMSDMMTRMMDYARTHPEGLPHGAPGQPAALPPELMPDMSMMIVPMLIVNLLGTVLLIAAGVRRLHDCDRTGWWVALPLPFRVIGAAIGPAAAKTMMTYPPQRSPLFMVSSLNGACSLLALVAFVILLIGESTGGPNRFGDPVPAN